MSDQNDKIEQERREIVARVVGEIIDGFEPLTHGAVGERIERQYPGFLYDPVLDDYTRHLGAPVTGKMASTESADQPATVSLLDLEPEAPAEGTAGSEPAVPAEGAGEKQPPAPAAPDEDGPEDADALRALAIEQDNEVAELRGRLHKLGVDRQHARQRYAASIQQFQAGLPKLSSDELIRQTLRASQAERAARAKGHLRPPPPATGASYIDRVSGGRGDADTFLRKQLRTGWRRGAYPASARGMKLPSQA